VQATSDDHPARVEGDSMSALRLGAVAWTLAACSSPIRIEEALYAGSCGEPVDVTRAVADSCGADGCWCDSACFAQGDDPAPGCEKDLEVTFRHNGQSDTITCGPSRDQRYVFVVSEDGAASCEAGACIQSGNACGPAGNPNGDCCTGYCDENGVCGL
jgi:hypothetical protein